MRAKWLLIFIGWAVLMLFALGGAYYLLIRAQGMTVTSWWRSPWKNVAVGGAPNSRHLLGLAWDIVPVTRENEEKLLALGLNVINEGDHLHAMLG